MALNIILGTRPEIIKMFPVIKECEKQDVNYFLLHTGQHYDFNMDKIFFKELNIKLEAINLEVGSGRHGETTGKMLIKIEGILMDKKPEIVLVQGDTNSVLAGSLASVKLHIPIGHVEAGLRSYDKKQPEEYNRMIADHISNYLFAPTEVSKDNLIKEGLPKEIIYLTGNTIVDTLMYVKSKIDKSDILNKLNLDKENYFLVTAHREENVDSKNRLLGIIEGLKKISHEYNIPIIFPIHPRTRNRLKQFSLMGKVLRIKNLRIVDPLGYFDLLKLEKNAKLILTDSGGIVEEACILKTPCVSLRDKTDRPESIFVGASALSGCSSEKILETTKKMLSKKKNWKNPFGDGKAAKRIVNVIKDSKYV